MSGISGTVDTCLRGEGGFCRLALAGNPDCFAGRDGGPARWCNTATADQKRNRLIKLCKAKSADAGAVDVAVLR